MAKFIYTYRLVEHGEYHFAVHTNGLFLAGFDDNDDPIWSENLQDSATWCRESAELLAAEHNASYSPITVDCHLEA